MLHVEAATMTRKAPPFCLSREAIEFPRFTSMNGVYKTLCSHRVIWLKTFFKPRIIKA